MNSVDIKQLFVSESMQGHRHRHGKRMAWCFIFASCMGLVMSTSVEKGCKDIQGRFIQDGHLFVPSGDGCMHCTCSEGEPKWCKAVLCAPPQDCTSFRLGKSCCEFLCVEDALPPHGDGSGSRTTTDLGLRLVASAVTAVLSLALLLFLIHRLRQKRLQAELQNQRYREDHGSVTSTDGYLTTNRAYLDGWDQVEFLFDEPPLPPYYFLHKPADEFFPRGEPPPPYSEAMMVSVALPSSTSENQATSGSSEDVMTESFLVSEEGTSEEGAAGSSPSNDQPVLRSDELYEDCIVADPEPVEPHREVVCECSQVSVDDRRVCELCSHPHGQETDMENVIDSVSETCVEEVEAAGTAGELEKQRKRNRQSAVLLNCSEQDATLHRFSLQLHFDLSDTSSSSLTLSPDHQMASPSSSSSSES